MAQLTAAEVLELAAKNNDFYSQYFFPRTFRQKGAPFHPQIWEALETPGERLIDCEVFRGGAKTTLLRTFTSKRIALGSSRTILYVSETQDHAKRSVRWLKNQVLFNKKWATFFKLSLGTKKTDEWLEIVHGVDGITISVLAIGITGQTRGLNLDDFRPDLIVVDDPCNEENTATPEQRKKMEDLFFGALLKSLAPPTEAQDAKMVLLQTSLNGDDLINQCHRDPAWRSFKFSCFDEDENSTWEERFPTEFLRNDKASHRKMNRLPLWYREMECKIVAGELSEFRADWLKDMPENMLPEGGVNFYYIDPVPPPSDKEIANSLKKKDNEAHAVVKYYQGDYYICDIQSHKGHDPDWSVMKFWELVQHWSIVMWEVEPRQYQRTLKWLIEKSMQRFGKYIRVNNPPKMDMRPKHVRIVQSLQHIAAMGHLYVDRGSSNPAIQRFINQFTEYPNVNHDDELEAVANAVKMAQEHGPLMDTEFEVIEDDHSQFRGKPRVGYAP